MEEEASAGCLSVFMWILDIAISILLGILAWNWIEPDGFGRGLLFVLVWGLMIPVGHFITMGIIALITRLFGQ